MNIPGRRNTQPPISSGQLDDFEFYREQLIGGLFGQPTHRTNSHERYDLYEVGGDAQSRMGALIARPALAVAIGLRPSMIINETGLDPVSPEQKYPPDIQEMSPTTSFPPDEVSELYIHSEYARTVGRPLVGLSVEIDSQPLISDRLSLRKNIAVEYGFGYQENEDYTQQLHRFDLPLDSQKFCLLSIEKWHFKKRSWLSFIKDTETQVTEPQADLILKDLEMTVQDYLKRLPKLS